MGSQLSSEALALGKEAFRLAMEHGVEHLDQITVVEKEAEARFQDIHGRPADLRSISSQDGLECEQMRAMAFDSYVIRNPGFTEIQTAIRQRQMTVEDRLGQLLTNDPPPFIIEALGPPPETSGTTHNWLVDPRHWARKVHNPPMTTRQFWERAAGAYASVIAGRCDGDPELVGQMNAGSHDPSNLFHRASGDAFTGVAEFVRTTRNSVRDAPRTGLGL